MIGPHKVTRPEDGVTFYYNGVSMYPLLAVEPDGSHYAGWGVNLDDPQVVAAIRQADKRVYHSTRVLP